MAGQWLDQPTNTDMLTSYQDESTQESSNILLTDERSPYLVWSLLDLPLLPELPLPVPASSLLSILDISSYSPPNPLPAGLVMVLGSWSSENPGLVAMVVVVWLVVYNWAVACTNVCQHCQPTRPD